jgi:PAS domain S-box-containing protein
MNKAFFLQLVFNASLLLTLALIYELVIDQWRTKSTILTKLPAGIILGGMGVIVMLASWKFETGIVFDTRSILLGISGLYFGTVPTIAAMVITAAYRWSLGGIAVWMGIAVIVSSGAIGIFWRLLRRDFLADISWRELLMFGLILHVDMLGCMLFLPGSVRWHVLANIALPVLFIYPVVTAVLGRLMADHLKRERTKQRLRESEERYQNLAKIAPVGIFRTDPYGATTYVNPMWCRISGLSEAESLGNGWLNAVHPDEREGLDKGWQETIRLKKPSFADYRFLRPDGTEAWVMGQASPEINSKKEIVGYVGTITDISAIKLAEGVIRSSLAEKETLLKEVHHRVKNNLMSIIGLIEMEKAKAKNEASHVMLLKLEGRVRSMALVHDYLHRAKDLARIDLKNYVETLTAHIRGQFGAERNIRCTVHAVKVEVNLDIAVPCGLIMNELITNAFRHAFRGEKTRANDGTNEITVSLKSGKGICVLTVADNGTGLPADLDWEKSETQGLQLIKMLSRQIQGLIELDRSAGTSVSLKFPVAVP